MTQLRVGVDVGGTNTDAVLLHGNTVLATAKHPTTPDVASGISGAIGDVISQSGAMPGDIEAVMLGTTHFLNALIEHRNLMPVGILRLCGQATGSAPPMCGWPQDLAEKVGHYAKLLPGGFEFDGRAIEPLNEAALRDACAQMQDKRLLSVAITGVFSALRPEQEAEARAIVQDAMPDAYVSISSEIGRLGLLERENATILNACLRDLSAHAITAYEASLQAIELDCPLYISQNDGTLMSAARAREFPVMTFASGPTNSMRGAAFLSGIENAIVVDIGGTTTDVGVLMNGMPRETSAVVEVAGVRTNFRMPDVYSVGLGGGSIVRSDAVSVGPDSVGHALMEKALCFGGDTTTATDIVAALGQVAFGQPVDLDASLVAQVDQQMRGIIDDMVDRVRLSADPIPVILVGGGSILVHHPIEGASRILRPEHFGAANAVGAAMSQVSGEVDRTLKLNGRPRSAAVEEVKEQAHQACIDAGALAESIEILDIEHMALAYLTEDACRIRVKAVGELAK
ncbi:hydantoinase/oxoprolinase family protein [Ruegeria sp. EL01]|uniref:hydantoinase/oxoprolinase family protein n=1 Tax=Ruegeria sp. EL01 TaxID=2107578 RepID=UPI001C200DF4|nr:hydantoinase/oxoprolinase family protein [Ruegeria sp. EL01]